MAVSMESTVLIARPVGEVFGRFLELEKNMPDWDPDIESAVKTSEGPFGVGSAFRVRQRLLGRVRDVTMLVTGLDPDQRIDFAVKAGPVAPTLSFLFEEAEGGTRLTARGEPNPVGPFKLFKRRLARYGQQLWDKRLARIKGALEGSGSA